MHGSGGGFCGSGGGGGALAAHRACPRTRGSCGSCAACVNRGAGAGFASSAAFLGLGLGSGWRLLLGLGGGLAGARSAAGLQRDHGVRVVLAHGPFGGEADEGAFGGGHGFGSWGLGVLRAERVRGVDADVENDGGSKLNKSDRQRDME